MHDFPAMKKYVGRKALRYDQRRTPKTATQRDQATVESYLAKIPLDSSLLDLPVGTGRFISFCAGKGFNYTGVDISPDMLRVARTKVPSGAAKVRLQVADARALPFLNDAFDYTIVIKFIKWLPNSQILTEVLREIGRVTRKEAFVQITVSRDSQSLRRRATKLLKALPLIGKVFPPKHSDAGKGGSTAYSEQELAVAFSAAGLKVDSIMHGCGPKRSTSRAFYVLSKSRE